MTTNPSLIPTSVIDNQNQIVQANDSWQTMKNNTLAAAEAKLQNEIQVMDSLNPMIACQYAMLVLGQAGECSMIQDVGIPSTEMNENSSIGNMLNSIQSNIQTLEGDAAGYNGNLSSSEIQAGSTVWYSLLALQKDFQEVSEPGTQFYGMCSPEMANSMLDSINGMINLLEAPGGEGVTTGAYVANEIMTNYQNYEKDPTGSEAIWVNNLNSDLASSLSQVSGNSAQLNQQMNTGTKEAEQFFAGLEQQMKSQNTLAMAEIQNENVQ
ncbi:MAG: hypothetical protein KF898_03115 [Parachlamydiales bacterium]|nr:hypothetical protein [Verrucomicrobiota bacterium]MBX3718623.1 hypothetical protein [Candidatus Acheromyda pituitae]